jgi:hypothetical protein
MSGYLRPLVVTGPQAIRAATQLAKIQDRRDQWPYPWSFPPPSASRVTIGLGTEGTLAAPAPATQAQVLEYTVRSGFMFWLVSIVQVYLGTGFTPGSGDIIWSLDRNTPLGGGTLQGSPIQGFQAVDVPLGSLVLPWTLDMPEVFQPYDVIRSKVLTTSAIPAGAPNYFKSVFRGWLAPATEV